MWLNDLLERVEAKGRQEVFHPVIEEFKDLIENDPIIYMLFHQMFSQVPDKPRFNRDPNGNPQVRDYFTMLACFNEIMASAPEYRKGLGLAGFPINAIINWPMGTPSGAAAFLNEKVNAQVGKMLKEWAKFLGSPESRYCQPSEPHRGFKSWDDFFTREFRDGARPIGAPDDDRFIANACESAPYNLQKNVQERDLFWTKGQPYSIKHMLAGDSFTPLFVEGTVYQGFLDALSYHRWHSPVTGRVVKAYIQPGTYFSEATMAGFDEAAPNESQGYLTEVATRALVFIEADNPDIGLMCFMAVGMAEVSTCDIRVQVGQQVKKGEQLGMFHFGGSTHCLIFRKSVNLVFDLPCEPAMDASIVPVNRSIAFVPPRRINAKL
ncbi:Phophatidylserine decarboxylase-domain-containing protein [Tuber brumale]|nr:Phophatidylserine decarboxylase-domain-containing protein [Tuber brumale]